MNEHRMGTRTGAGTETRAAMEMGTSRLTIGGGRGSHKFVFVLGGDGTKKPLSRGFI